MANFKLTNMYISNKVIKLGLIKAQRALGAILSQQNLLE